MEVKSATSKTGPDRDDLRQLDDWVFDLSGEEYMRKGITTWISRSSEKGGGQLVPLGSHPTRKKGVMVFNGPTALEFERRTDNWLGKNELEFANKRNFCVISLSCLLKWEQAINDDPEERRRLWKAIQHTVGVLDNP